MVVKRNTLCGEWSEEKVAEEAEGEGAHLRGEWRREDEGKKAREGLTSSVSAGVASCAIAKRKRSGVRASLLSTTCSALVAVGRVQGLRSMCGAGY